jgi:hypothetical protein
MVTLYRPSDDHSEHPDDHNLAVGIAAVIVAMVFVITIGMGIVGSIRGNGNESFVDPSQTMTYNGQVFGHFQPEEINGFYGVAEQVRGTPIPMDPLWNVVPARAAITIGGVVYQHCEGVGPIVEGVGAIGKDRPHYQELVCKR